MGSCWTIAVLFPQSPNKRLVTRQRRCCRCGTFEIVSTQSCGETILVRLKKSICLFIFRMFFFALIMAFFGFIRGITTQRLSFPVLFFSTQVESHKRSFTGAKEHVEIPSSHQNSHNDTFFSPRHPGGNMNQNLEEFFFLSLSICPLQLLPASVHLDLSLAVGTMALALCAILLALLRFTHATTPDCEDLVKPIMPEDPNQVFGRWVYTMGAGDPQPYHKALESMKSSWIKLSPTSDPGVVTLRWGDRCFNRCILGTVNATVSGLATTFRKNLSDHKGHILQTCTDCLLWTDTFRNGDVTGRFMLQFTRSGGIDPTGVELFKKQLSCLNFPENFHSYDGKTELCPDDKQSTS